MINSSILRYACLMANHDIIKIILDSGTHLGLDLHHFDSDRDLDFIIRNKFIFNKESNIINHISDFKPLEALLNSLQIYLETIKMLIDYGAEITIDCLFYAVRLEDLEIFQFLYQNTTFSLDQQSDILLFCFKNNYAGEIGLFLQKILAYDLEDCYLEKIIHQILIKSEIETFQYFVNFYGKERISKLINYDLYEGATAEYLDNDF